MKLVFTSYVKAPGYSDPEQWLKYIDAFTGIPEALCRKHTVTVIERISFEGRLEKNGVRYIFINPERQVTRFPHRMHKMIKALSPDVVFINGLTFPLQVIQLRWKLGRNTKIFLLHRADKPLRGIKKYIQRLADRCVNGYLFVSSGFADQWKNNITVKKMYEVIQASSVFKTTDRGEARKQLQLTGSPVFFWVGNLDSNKDPLTVVKAFLQFSADEPNARLYMAYRSDGLLAAIRSLTGNNPAVQLLGKKERHELQLWYNAADFIISGSHYEGSGVAVCEAMSCGCIPVLTDIISFRKMTGPGACGFLYEPGNVSALLNILLSTKKLDMEEERRKTMARFRNELSFEAIADKINRIITDEH